MKLTSNSSKIGLYIYAELTNILNIFFPSFGKSNEILTSVVKLLISKNHSSNFHEG